MDKYKISALAGTAIMGVGAFMACLAENSVYITIGNGLLIFSMAVMVYGYSKWQP